METFLDLGYKKIEKDLPQFHAILLRKKRNGERLTLLQKQLTVSSQKLELIDHTISKIKKFKIMHDVFRNRL
jgi:hypothetical protein